MANNPYVNKVIYGGQTLIDLTSDTVSAAKLLSGETAHDKSGAQITGSIASKSGKSFTPTRSQQTYSTNGKYLTGDIVVNAIPGTYYTMEEAMELMFPVNSIYISASSTAPTFGGTWTEIRIPASWGDIEDGNRSYINGQGSGTLHFWKRIS